MPHFDTTISIPTLVMVVIGFAAWIRAQTLIDLRVKSLEDSRDRQDHSIIEVVANTTLLRESNAKVAALLAGQDRRLILLEDINRFRQEDRAH